MRILVIGELIDDVFCYGSVKRLNPESPTPLLSYTYKTHNKGGAGNVYENLRSLRPNYQVDFIHQKNQIIKTRFVDETSGYILLRLDENDKALDCFDRNILLGEDNKILNYDAIVFSSYNKGFVTEKDIEEVAHHCQDKIPVFVDCKFNLGAWSKNTIVKINKREYDNLTNYDCKNLIVTLGKDGAMWNNIIYPTKEVEVRSIVGCGDSFLAALVVKYLEIKDMPKSIVYANKAASFAASKLGVVHVTEADIN